MAGGGYDYLLKITLVGAAKVGKTCLLTRYAEDTFNPSYDATIGEQLCPFVCLSDVLLV